MLIFSESKISDFLIYSVSYFSNLVFHHAYTKPQISSFTTSFLPLKYGDVFMGLVHHTYICGIEWPLDFYGSDELYIYRWRLLAISFFKLSWDLMRRFMFKIIYCYVIDVYYRNCLWWRLKLYTFLTLGFWGVLFDFNLIFIRILN